MGVAPQACSWSRPGWRARMRRTVAASSGPGLVVAVVVRQVRGDHDQRLVAAPQTVQHLGHLVGGGVADRERHQRELAERALQERQLHLQRVLLRVRRRGDHHLRQVADRVDRLARPGGTRPSGVAKAAASGKREPADRHAMAGSEQDDTRHAPARTLEQLVGARSDRARNTRSPRAARSAPSARPRGPGSPDAPARVHRRARGAGAAGRSA